MPRSLRRTRAIRPSSSTCRHRFAALRFGVSYAPEFTVNKDAGDPRRRIIQKDAVEAAVQYSRPIANDWSLGVSASLTRGNSDPQTQRRDLSAWSTGLELRREELVIGAAYVDNGDSNDAAAVDEREWNAGVAWRGEKWGAGVLPGAQMQAFRLDLTLLGVGGYYSDYRTHRGARRCGARSMSNRGHAAGRLVFGDVARGRCRAVAYYTRTGIKPSFVLRCPG